MNNMTLLQTIDSDIRKANARMTEIRVEQKVLEKEWQLTNDKKYELEDYRARLIAEQETKSSE